MTKEQIIILVESIAIAILIIVIIVMAVRHYQKINGSNKADNVKVIKGVRYTENKNEVDQNGDVSVTHRVGDIVLERGKEYKVHKNGSVMPGKYTILSNNDSTEVFNIRIDGFVREYHHQDDVVLADGSTVSAVSHSVILR